MIIHIFHRSLFKFMTVRRVTVTWLSYVLYFVSQSPWNTFGISTALSFFFKFNASHSALSPNNLNPRLALKIPLRRVQIYTCR